MEGRGGDGEGNGAQIRYYRRGGEELARERVGRSAAARRVGGRGAAAKGDEGEDLVGGVAKRVFGMRASGVAWR